jgi:hypothetical protein
LHTVIVEIKNKMESTHKYSFRFSQSRPKVQQESPTRLLNKTEFKIKTINLSPEQKHKGELTKSYVEATQRRLAEEKRNRRLRYDRF